MHLCQISQIIWVLWIGGSFSRQPFSDSICPILSPVDSWIKIIRASWGSKSIKSALEVVGSQTRNESFFAIQILHPNIFSLIAGEQSDNTFIFSME